MRVMSAAPGKEKEESRAALREEGAREDIPSNLRIIRAAARQMLLTCTERVPYI